MISLEKATKKKKEYEKIVNRLRTAITYCDPNSYNNLTDKEKKDLKFGHEQITKAIELLQEVYATYLTRISEEREIEGQHKYLNVFYL